MKKFYALLAAATISASAFAQTTTTTFDFSAQSYANSQVVSSGIIDSNLSFTTAKNASNNAPAYYTGDNSIRFYYGTNGAGGSMTITPKNGAKINSVVINAVSNYTPTVKYSSDSGAAANAALNGNTYTITGLSAANSLMFQNANATNTQLRVTSVTITYTGGTLGIADISTGNKALLKNTAVQNTLEFGTKSDVKIINMSGQLVKSASVESGSSLDVSGLAKGMYFVTGTVNGEKVSQKIIKK